MSSRGEDAGFLVEASAEDEREFTAVIKIAKVAVKGNKIFGIYRRGNAPGCVERKCGASRPIRSVGRIWSPLFTDCQSLVVVMNGLVCAPAIFSGRKQLPGPASRRSILLEKIDCVWWDN
jgi:hypothetical protein